MKKLLLGLTLFGLLAFALAGPAGAQPSAPTGLVGIPFRDTPAPTIGAVDPATAFNDLSTPVTITGTGFATDTTGADPILPAVTLGTTPLTDVACVDATTLTARVPFGINAGVYDLTVTNPDGGTATLPAVFTVKAGIGAWNGSKLYGGDVRQILMKPDDSHTLYAPAYGLLGLFRSTDAGEHWTYTGGALALSNNELAVTPQHPDWIWAYAPEGVKRSTDVGDTWTTIMPHNWPAPDGRQIDHGQVYPSLSDPDVLFVSSYYEPLENGSATGPKGLIKSANGGASWTIVDDLAGVSVMDVAFQPGDGAQMTLVTQDAHVYHSSDAGSTWSRVADLPVSSVGFTHELAYNPYVPGEVWVLSSAPDRVFKSSDAALSGWKDVTPAYSASTGIAFTGAGTVHLTHWKSSNGGTDWTQCNPMSANGSLIFDPSDSQVGYVGDGTCGVQKTTDGGATWEVRDQGLTGMVCREMAVSRADPLRVFSAFGNWPGVYMSQDGAGSWSYQELGGGAVQLVRADPVDPEGVYAASDHVFRSTGGGATWDDLGWNTSPTAPAGTIFDLEPDPFVPGHLLASLATGDYLSGPGYLYASGDFGVSWHPVALPQAVGRIQNIAFDPSDPGRVYFTSNSGGGAAAGTGVLRSIDGGVSWESVDDPARPGMRQASAITIATHPRNIVFVSAQGGEYRSLDGGDTWQKPETAEYLGMYLFADGDSTRLYGAGWNGLYYSSDAGDSWVRAAGGFAGLQITALDAADVDGHTIIYAATNGGQAGTSASAAAARTAAASRTGVAAARTGAAARTASTTRAGLTASGGMVAAGIYRYVIVKPRLTLKLSGLSSGVLRFERRVTAKGVVTPTALAGSTLKLSAQRKRNGHWVTVKTVTRTAGSAGAYSWAYRPARRGTYRVHATMTKTATRTAATTTWHGFRVK